MKITVLGLWHLGCVTAACCAEHFEVTGLDFDEETIRKLRDGKAPISEPGLDELIRAGLDSQRLNFTSDAALACHDTEILWVCVDTPVDEEDQPDVDAVLNQIRQCLPHLRESSVLLISSQLPVGTCQRLEAEFPGRSFACSPENLRLSRALEIFRNPDRVVIGVRDEKTHEKIARLFKPFSGNLIWMSPESAEMTKHAINAFLAMCISFMNELGRLCEATGADAKEVERGLKSENRIGPRAYLHAGGAFAGGTLARDVVTLTQLAEKTNEPLVLIPSIKQSNDAHKRWALRKLQKELGELRGKIVAVLGMTYKPGTDTLRRSLAVELCRELLHAGCELRVFDPAIKALPAMEDALRPDIFAAVNGADAVVICTEWPEFKKLDWNALVRSMRGRIIIDANGFVADETRHLATRYFTVGAPTQSTQ